EVAARAVPDAVVVAVALEPLDRLLVARVADEAHALRQRRRPEELGVRLHRVALRNAAPAVDAERLLVDDVDLLLRDDVLLSAGIVGAGLQPGLHVPDLLPAP